MSAPTRKRGGGVLMVNCRRASILLSQREDLRLGRADAFKLRLHLALCRHCRAVARQFALIRLAMRRLRDRDE